MTPRSLIRWKSFWLGVLVLGFLGWAWMRSNERSNSVEWITAKGGTIIGQREGQVWFYRGGVPAFYSKGLRRTDDVLFEGGPPFQVPLFPDAVDCDLAEGSISLSFAHWFLILLFLVPWVGFLAWRVRRQRRHTA